MKVLGIIPARGGSKGIPRKNIRLLRGKPLLAYTAESALRSGQLQSVVLSTDDEEIAAIGRGLGVDVPFLRPPELAADSTPTFSVIVHALDFLECAGHKYDAVCLLQPTNPLRTTQEIDDCVELLRNSDADSVVSVLPVPECYNPHWVYLKSQDGTIGLSTGEIQPIPRRQELPDAFHRDGSVYVTRTRALRKYQNLYGRKIMPYENDPRRSVNIDTFDDWERAEMLMGDHLRSGNHFQSGASLRI
jgi:CMP-N-acetylneuraminic acid synthetase